MRWSLLCGGTGARKDRLTKKGDCMLTSRSRLTIVGSVLLFAIATVVAAQQPSSSPSPIKHVPIALPEKAPSDWDPETWRNFRRRCQEVADMSAANLPMGSGDYGYADACTKEGAYYHPVKRRPVPVVAPTVAASPGPDGHIPLDIPTEPPKGSPYEANPSLWARMRSNCQEVADRLYAHEPVDHEEWLECGRMRMTVRAYNGTAPSVSPPAPVSSPIVTVTPTPTSLGAAAPVTGASSVGPFGTTFSGGGAMPARVRVRRPGISQWTMPPTFRLRS